MPQYALLIAPSANRVYADAAPRLCRTELLIFGSVLTEAPRDVVPLTLGGVSYVGFGAELSPRDIAYLSNLSSIYALFEVVEPDLLRPVGLNPLAHFDDDLITIPKYAGKTNEQFTRMLLNLTVLASDADLLGGAITVLDPLCGRGTTLNQALVYGYRGIGVELDGKDVDLYASFLRTYLQRKRIKHRTELNPVRRNGKLVGRRFEAHIGADTSVTVLHADTVRARDLLKAACADVIVVDLPYGVAHGSHAGGALARGPLALLREAAPVWAELLKPGGALGMSWNTHVAKRADAAGVLADAGLVPVDDAYHQELEHWVDQAITRDVIIARRPR
jgi:SAM-dependent methyltransferase